MKTIILGKESILTTRLKENLKNCEIISTRKIENIEIYIIENIDIYIIENTDM